MTNSIHMPFLSREISIVDSADPTLIGVKGKVLEETRRTIIVQTQSGEKTFAKDVIQFTLDLEKNVIDGATVTQRPEDRINRKYRRN
ncbi:ribonuclease P protein subunit [Euryarchaeota archaeon]|nr:ribonuclease P protein subunit [Euryarchaeota archaeon]MDC3310078.1 ribonuclease P protein subunit [Candidatus Poseidoniales archaeon]MDG1543104.1 ribonuclease P protein subunit [Candidatus Thalassarchaeaceae archaeon]